MVTWDECMTRRPDPEPRLELLETCWQLRSPTGRVLSCGLYRTDVPGFELRVGCSTEDLLYSSLVWDKADANATAEELRQTVLAKGFTEV